jgi:hypothetical protein
VAAEPHSTQYQEQSLQLRPNSTHATRVREAKCFCAQDPTTSKLGSVGWERLGYLAFRPQIRHRHAGRRLGRYMGTGVLLLRGRMLFINHSDLAPPNPTHRLNICLNVTQLRGQQTL